MHDSSPPTKNSGWKRQSGSSRSAELTKSRAKDGPRTKREKKAGEPGRASAPSGNGRERRKQRKGSNAAHSARPYGQAGREGATKRRLHVRLTPHDQRRSSRGKRALKAHSRQSRRGGVRGTRNHGGPTTGLAAVTAPSAVSRHTSSVEGESEATTRSPRPHSHLAVVVGARHTRNIEKKKRRQRHIPPRAKGAPRNPCQEAPRGVEVAASRRHLIRWVWRAVDGSKKRMKEKEKGEHTGAQTLDNTK